MTNRLENLSPGAQTFLETVRGQLCDLSPSDQADLIEQVEHRLQDLDASDEPNAIETHLGEPADLANDLRAAAGFSLVPTQLNSAARASSSLDTLRAVAGHRVMRPVIRYLDSLRPAWWAVRGYLLVAGVLAVISQGGGYRLHTIGSYTQASRDTTPIHPNLVWLLIPAAAVVASIALGLTTSRLPRTARLLVAAMNIVAIALLLAYPTWWLAPAFAYYSGMVT